jgi:membrane protein implicated in regulation of membrane protease activity
LSSLFDPSTLRMFSEPLTGTVLQAIASSQSGWIRYAGTDWSARLYQPKHSIVIRPGASVSIVAIQGNTLIVIPTDRNGGE